MQKPSWPSVDGGSYTTQQLVRGLAQRGHEVRLLAVRWRGDRVGAVADLPPSVSQRTVALSRTGRWMLAAASAPWRGRSVIWQRYGALPIRRALDEELRRGDWSVLQADGIQVARVCLEVVRGQRTAPPVVYRAHNREALLLKRRATGWGLLGRGLARLEVARQHCEELAILRSADAVAAINDVVADAARQASARRVTVLRAAVAQEASEPTEHATVGFLGSVDWWPNRQGLRWFLRDVWPTIRREIPEARIGIAGRAAEQWPPAERPAGTHGWTAVARSRAFLRSLGIFVAPVHWSAGQQIKVLEAFSAGLAVVATPSAVAELDGGREACRVAEDPADFAAAVVALLRDASARRRLAERALAVAALHRRDVVAQAAEELYRDLGPVA